MGSLSATMEQKGRAAEWSAEPSVSVKGEYNSNLTLSPVPGEVLGHWVSPSVRFAGSTERLEVSGRAAGDFVAYYGDQDRSLTNLFFPLAAKYSTERNVFGLDGSFTRDNTLMSELQRTGVVLGFTQRNLWSVSPSWTYAATDHLSVQTGYQFARATYEDGRRLGLFDYEVHGGSLGAAYKLTERDEVQLNGSYSHVDLWDAGLTIRNSGASAVFTHSLTEATTISVSGGPRLIDQTQRLGGVSLSDAQLVWVFGGSIQTKREDARASLDATREVNVSGLGLLLRTDRLGASISKDFTEHLTLSLSGQVFVVQTIPVQGAGLQVVETRLITVTPALAWKLNDWWSVEASYTYADRRTDVTNEFGHGNLMFVKVTYIVPKLSVSR